MEETAQSLGRELPTQEDIAAILTGIRRYGISGLVTRSGTGWSIVAGAGFGCAVKAESLHILRSSLKTLNLYADQQV